MEMEEFTYLLMGIALIAIPASVIYLIGYIPYDKLNNEKRKLVKSNLHRFIMAHLMYYVFVILTSSFLHMPYTAIVLLGIGFLTMEMIRFRTVVKSNYKNYQS